MFSRTIEPKINEYMQGDKIIFIVGARQVGKTTLLRKNDTHIL